MPVLKAYKKNREMVNHYKQYGTKAKSRQLWLKFEFCVRFVLFRCGQVSSFE